MSNPAPIRLLGNTPSPYTQKMVALLRYRQIPYSVHWGDTGSELDAMGIERPKPMLLPVFLMPQEDGKEKAICDSTPIIRTLESMYAGRSVLPTDPAVAFIDYLLEDFGDEWCTKYMFHYRWYPQADADNAGTLLPLGVAVSMPGDMHRQMKEFFSKRQIERLYVVGSNDITAPIIDASYRRYLAAMEAHLGNQPFLLGKRPGAGDFALHGQLTQLVGFDPTPRAIAHEVSPRTVAWTDLMRDMSGLEPTEDDWNSADAFPETLKAILQELGRGYVPAMLKNAEAVAAGDKTWETEIDGALWTQQTFPYQAKCLRWINEQYAALDDASRQKVNAVLEGTGCEALLAQ